MHTDAQEHTQNHKHTHLRKLIMMLKDIQLINNWQNAKKKKKN